MSGIAQNYPKLEFQQASTLLGNKAGSYFRLSTERMSCGIFPCIVLNGFVLWKEWIRIRNIAKNFDGNGFSIFQ